MTKTSKPLMTRRNALLALGGAIPFALGAGAALAHESRGNYGGHMHGRGYHHGHDDDHHHGEGHHHGYGDTGAHHGHDHRHDDDDDRGPHHHGERWRDEDRKS